MQRLAVLIRKDGEVIHVWDLFLLLLLPRGLVVGVLEAASPVRLVVLVSLVVGHMKAIIISYIYVLNARVVELHVVVLIGHTVQIETIEC